MYNSRWCGVAFHAEVQAGGARLSLSLSLLCARCNRRSCNLAVKCDAEKLLASFVQSSSDVLHQKQSCESLRRSKSQLLARYGALQWRRHSRSQLLFVWLHVPTRGLWLAEWLGRCFHVRFRTHLCSNWDKTGGSLRHERRLTQDLTHRRDTRGLLKWFANVAIWINCIARLQMVLDAVPFSQTFVVHWRLVLPLSVIWFDCHSKNARSVAWATIQTCRSPAVPRSVCACNRRLLSSDHRFLLASAWACWQRV